MGDYFEIDRLVEDLAKIYSTACATTWFKVTKNQFPSKEAFRLKVTEFMKHFEYSLSTYPEGPESDRLRIHAKKILYAEIEKILAGNNKEVEKRYQYYIEYG